jgi:hypothetical protein
MKSIPMFTISKTRGPFFSHFNMRSPDGFSEVNILTGGDSDESKTITVFCIVRGVKNSAMFSSGKQISFKAAVDQVANTVRCLAVGNLREREFLLQTVLEFGPNLSIEPAPVGRGSRRAVPSDSAPISVDQHSLAVNSPSDLCSSVASRS